MDTFSSNRVMTDKPTFWINFDEFSRNWSKSPSWMSFPGSANLRSGNFGSISNVCIKCKSDLAKLTYMYEHFAEICGNGTGMLWKRMFEGMWSRSVRDHPNKSIRCAQEGYRGWHRVLNWPQKENKKAWRRIYKSLLLLDYLGMF